MTSISLIVGALRTSSGRAARSRFKQVGTSLPFALIALAGLSVTGVSMMRSTTTSALISGNLGFRETAMRATDVAVEAAVTRLTGVTDRTADSSANTYFASLASPVTEIPANTRFSAYTTDATTGVQYRYSIERMCDSTGSAAAAYCAMKGDTAYYRITGEAAGPKGATQISQVFVTLTESKGPCGIMTQETIEVSGKSTSLGTSRCFHSNENLNVNGEVVGTTPKLSISATFTAAYKDGPSSTVTIEPTGSVRTLPEVKPSAHAAYATQTFGTDASSMTGTGFASGDWKFVGSGSDIRWELDKDFDSGTCPSGLFYFKVNVVIGKKMGNSSTPCKISIISEKSITISGEQHMENFRDTASSVPAATNDVFVMAGGDLSLSGSSKYADPTKNGLIAAGAQIKVEGSPRVEASLISRSDPAPAGSSNLTDKNLMAGELTQEYNGGGAATGTPTATRHSWRAATN